jgi:uncharacterized delta-60 repeat protein
MLLGVWAITAALIGGAEPAHAAPGALDRSFGYGGKVVSAASLGASWNQASVEAAIAPNGDILVAAGERLARYLPEGRLDRSFGNSGLVNIEMPEGLVFWLGDLAVDYQGRAIVIGTATERGAPDPRGDVGDVSIRSLAAFARYSDDGSLDPTFGQGGVVLTDFGLQADSPYAKPAVIASAGAVDPAGRIATVAGTRDLAVPCTTHPHFYRFDKAIVRLTPAGELDSTFGKGGARPLRPLTNVTGLTLGEAGEPIFTSTTSGCPPDVRLARLTADGSGSLETAVHEGVPQRIAVDPHGRIVLLEQATELLHRGKSVARLVRFDRDGNLDRGFGRNGAVSVLLPGRLSKLNALAANPRGGLLLAGTSVRQLGPRHGPGAPYNSRFVVVRLRPSGAIDRGFGHRGAVVTRFGAHANATGQEVLLDREGLIVVGSARVSGSAPRSGFALARYLGGSSY